MTTHIFLARHAQTYALPPAVPVTVDLSINGARHWRFVVKNTGDTNDLDAMTVERYSLGVDDLGEGPVAVTADLPLGPGESTRIVGTDEPIGTLRLVLTSSLGTSVRIVGGGR